MINKMVVTNKKQLMIAIKLCSFDNRTIIVNKREDGGKTVFKFPAGKLKFMHETEYNQHLNRVIAKIKRSPDVWQ